MSNLHAETLARTIASFYDAAYGVLQWEEALDCLATTFHGSRSWLFQTSSGAVNGYTSLDDEGFKTQEAQEAILRDPFHAVCSVLPAGTIRSHAEMIDIDAFRSRELWQVWLRPRDIYFGMQLSLKATSGSHYMIDVNRGARQDDFDNDDREAMRFLLPHLARAQDISILVDRSRTGNATSAALVVVDGELVILDCNEAAERLLAEPAAPLSTVGGKLRTDDPRQAKWLNELVGRAIAPSANEVPGGVTIFTAASPRGPQRIVASVAPHSLAAPFGFGGQIAAAIYMRPVHGAHTSSLDDLLRDLFSLSPAQAKLAWALASGISLRQAAAERGISYASARTYLETILRQTGTRRQPELVALLKTVQASRMDILC